MKILWLVNIIMPELAEQLGRKPSVFGGWLIGAMNAVREHNPECMECEFKSMCGCGCRAVALAATDDLLAADPTACAFFKGGYHERFAWVLADHGIAAR